MSITFKDIMEYDLRNQVVFNKLVELQRKSILVPFIGAGMSAFLGFPCWGDFLSMEFELYCKNYQGGIPTDMNYYEAASKLCYELTETYFYNDVRKAFGGDWAKKDWDEKLNNLNMAAAYWLPKLFEGLVITTNFDHMLEHIYNGFSVSDPNQKEPINRSMQQGTSLIYKIHGDILDSENIIFTKESYQRYYESNSPIRKALNRVFSNKSILFLGCSLEKDKTVELWEKTAQAGMEHFAIVHCTPGKQNAKRHELGEKRVQTIIYDSSDHDAVRIILEKLYTETGKTIVYHNLPYARNKFFTGRGPILDLINEKFQSRKSINLCQSISGLGGVGKTQCALEFAYRYKSLFRYIFWVNSETQQSIKSSFQKILQSLSLVSNEVLLEEELKSRVNNLFESNSNILVIFDNLDEEEYIKSYLPPDDKACVLITSRKLNVNFCLRIDVSVFDEEEAIAFLMKRTGKTDRNGAKIITQRLGCLALALDQAAAYILKTNMSFSEYANILNEYGLDVFDSKMEITSQEYKKLVTTTWDITIKKLKWEGTRQLLFLCAYMSPDNIPIEFFELNRNLLPEPLKSDVSNKISLYRILADIQEYRLAIQVHNTLNIHRLVQEVVREKIKHNPFWLQCCVDIIEATMPRDYSIHNSRDTFNKYAEHAQSIMKYATSIEETKHE